jgi:phosphoribosylglycinamide formyltransferase-1
MAERARVAIFISGRGSNMEALIRAAQDPFYPALIALVVSNRPEAPGLTIAESLGVETVRLDHTSFTDKRAFEDALDRHCRTRGIDLIACAGFMRLMSVEFVEGWRGRMVNIHPSLLPNYPGLNTHERALADGIRIHGCTVHFVSADVDAGPIIAQAAVPVHPDDTAELLAQRVLGQEHRLYPMALDWLASGKVKLAQDRVIYGFEPERELATLMVPRTAKG